MLCERLAVSLRPVIAEADRPVTAEAEAAVPDTGAAA
jgi:hypothetical protein